MSAIFFFYILAGHWWADFMLQTHWQASNKSKNLRALVTHVTTYTLGMCWFLGLLTAYLSMFSYRTMFAFAAITWITHAITDAITSRITARLWAAESWHNFFVMIGFDQLIHYATLLATLAALGFTL